MESLHETTDATASSDGQATVSSGIMLTLEGPDGPSSVELSVAECVEIAEAVADTAAGQAAGGPAWAGQDAARENPAVPFARMLLERLPAGSPVLRWASSAAKSGGADESPADVPLLDRLRTGLAASSARSPSPAGRLLLRVVDLAAASFRQRAGFERAVVEARIESMKQLAYGAGHEINNPLANIATRAQSLLPAERDPERRKRLAAIIDQAFRARDMIGALMLFARPPKPDRREAHAQSIVAVAIAAVEAAAKARDVRIHLDAAAQELAGTWDPTQLAEAVRAVLMNAIEASRSGGEVRVFVAKDAANPAVCCLRVADDGQGMDRETLARAFDPFFSGREAGRGIGLGLSKVWRLVEINGGRTSIESKFGTGTTVSMLLPMTPEGEATAARKVAASSPV